MHGDFSRVTFDARNHYSRVLVQQGRAYMDAEPNEQAAIFLHAMRSLTRDIVGPHGVPASGPSDPSAAGFRIEPADPANLARGFRIGRGRYYVDGILCENDQPDAAYFDQPDYPVADPLPAGTFLVYLDVWERHVTYLDRPWLRETALGGPDTSSRAQVVWQVKVLEPDGAALSVPPKPEEIAKIIQGRAPEDQPRLRARVKPGDVSTTPCVMPPSGGYRGRENQLYRVEVHESGVAGAATFKWSRDNGSLIFPVSEISAASVTVEHVGLDATRTLVPGNWVELLDDRAVLHGSGGVMARVRGVSESRQVQLEPVSGALLTAVTLDRRPFLRRWDHRGVPSTNGAVIITESADQDTGWIDLEDGIQVQFQPRAAGQRYVSGDYWTIVARAGSGEIEWPRDAGKPAPLPPSGVEHHYAPLAMQGVAPIEHFRNLLQITVAPEPA
jgi:hypothetical protein